LASRINARFQPGQSRRKITQTICQERQSVAAGAVASELRVVAAGPDSPTEDNIGIEENEPEGRMRASTNGAKAFCNRNRIRSAFLDAPGKNQG